jgi:methionyl aminopeptidase
VFGRKGLESKTPDQIRRMRVAGVVVGETLELIRGLVSAGVTTGDLDKAAEEYIRGRGATPSFLGYHGFTGSLCVSVNEEVVHGIPGSRILHTGDLVSIDCGAIVDGWHGDAAVSLIVGGREAGSSGDLALMPPQPLCGPESPHLRWGLRCSTWAGRWRTPSSRLHVRTA